MHIKRQLYWLFLATVFMVTACQPKLDNEWFLKKENYDAIEETIHSSGLVFRTKSFLESRSNSLNQYAENFDKVNYDVLSEEGKLHYHTLKHLVDFELYLQDTLKIFEWDASNYRITPEIQTLGRLETSEKERFTSINEILAVSDSFYQIAKANITSAISIERGKLAVDQHATDFLFLQNDLAKQIEKSTISETLKTKIDENLKNTMLNIKDYIGYVMSVINNTDDLDDTTTVIKSDLTAINLRKYLGENIEDFDWINRIQIDLSAKEIEIVERDDYYFGLEELTEIEKSGDKSTMNILTLLALKELGTNLEELAIPFQKILDRQEERIRTYPYRYVAQLQNYQRYKAYRADLKKQNKNDKLAALDSYIQDFKDTPFIYIKQVLEE